MIHKQRDVLFKSLVLENGYLLDVEESPDTYTSWVYHKDVPIKIVVHRAEKTDCKSFITFMDDTLSVLSDSIKFYEEKIMDDGGDEDADEGSD